MNKKRAGGIFLLFPLISLEKASSHCLSPGRIQLWLLQMGESEDSVQFCFTYWGG